MFVKTPIGEWKKLIETSTPCIRNCVRYLFLWGQSTHCPCTYETSNVWVHWKNQDIFKSQLNCTKDKIVFRKKTVSVTEKMFVMFHMYKQHLEINMVSLFICCIMFLSCIEFISLAQMEFLPQFSIFFGKSFCVSFMVNGMLIYRSRIKNKIKPKEYFFSI